MDVVLALDYPHVFLRQIGTLLRGHLMEGLNPIGDHQTWCEQVLLDVFEPKYVLNGLILEFDIVAHAAGGVVTNVTFLLNRLRYPFNSRLPFLYIRVKEVAGSLIEGNFL